MAGSGLGCKDIISSRTVTASKYLTGFKMMDGLKKLPITQTVAAWGV